MSAWEGDISELGRLSETLGKLAGIPSRASRDASVGISQAIDEQFDAQVDPYGHPWHPIEAATVEKKGDDAILYETGKLRDGIRVAPSPGAGVQVTIEAEYAGFHQTGFHVGKRFVEPRPILPYAEIPDTWGRAISDALDNAFERSFA